MYRVNIDYNHDRDGSNRDGFVLIGSDGTSYQETFRKLTSKLMENVSAIVESRRFRYSPEGGRTTEKGVDKQLIHVNGG